MWLRRFSQSQISLDLTWVGFSASGDGMATLEAIQNERLFSFYLVLNRLRNV